jgi:hypothetical protein
MEAHVRNDVLKQSVGLVVTSESIVRIVVGSILLSGETVLIWAVLSVSLSTIRIAFFLTFLSRVFC